MRQRLAKRESFLRSTGQIKNLKFRTTPTFLALGAVGTRRSEFAASSQSSTRPCKSPSRVLRAQRQDTGSAGSHFAAQRTRSEQIEGREKVGGEKRKFKFPHPPSDIPRSTQPSLSRNCILCANSFPYPLRKIWSPETPTGAWEVSCQGPKRGPHYRGRPSP